MWQKVEWNDGPKNRRRIQAICTILAVATFLLIPVLAQAIAPPRPGSGATVPDALERWNGERPGSIEQVMRLESATKSGGLEHRIPVLPGDFSDRSSSISTATLQNVFTGSTSVRDYYQEVSHQQLTVSGEVLPWVRVPETSRYYGDIENGMDMWSAPRNAGRFVLDLVTAADAAGLDWGRFDNDGPDGLSNSGDDDGFVDCLVVVHAGPGGECAGSGLWSHSFFLSGWGYGHYSTQSSRHGGGVIKINDYIMVPEKSCGGGTIEIGVICHEYGHALGLPDLYDTVNGDPGIGGWGLMGTGSWGGDGQSPESPSHFCAWSRLDLGWCTAHEVEEDGLQTLEAGEVLSVRSEDQAAGELFLVENRPRTGYDQSLPGEGLLIWHLDGGVMADNRTINRVNANAVYGLALEQADGLEQLSSQIGGNRGDAGDPWPGTTGNSRFSAGSTPSSADNLGVRTDVVIRGILSPRTSASFLVEMGVTDLDITPPEVAIVVPAGGEDWTLGDVQTVVWSATDANELGTIDLQLSRDGGASFPVTLARNLSEVNHWIGSLGNLPGQNVILRAVVNDLEGNQGVGESQAFSLSDRYAPGVSITVGPRAGAMFAPGDVVSINWLSADNVAVEAVDFLLSCDGGQHWVATDIVDQLASGSVQWRVPNAVCAEAQLRVAARDAAGNVGSEDTEMFIIQSTTSDVPVTAAFKLGPCIPNPFNPRAEIVFNLPRDGRIVMAVHDARGRRLRTLVDEVRSAGRQSVMWDGRDDRGMNAASGVYWVRATSQVGNDLLKVTLVR